MISQCDWSLLRNLAIFPLQCIGFPVKCTGFPLQFAFSLQLLVLVAELGDLLTELNEIDCVAAVSTLLVYSHIRSAWHAAVWRRVSNKYLCLTHNALTWNSHYYSVNPTD